MNQIILIEDRPRRMELFFQKLKDNPLSNYSFLHIKTGKDFKDLENTLEHSEINTYFEPYNVIICHRSAFNENIRIKLKEYCRSTKKTLVFFSGGISESIFQHSGYPFLSLNTKTLYSDNFLLFLEAYAKGSANPAILQYGENWELDWMLACRDKINYLILYKKKDRTYIETLNNLKLSLQAAPTNIQLELNIGDGSPEEILIIKKKIDEEINKKFAFEL